MITKETIDKIFSAIRVEEIVGEYVQLKRAGSNYKGLSPFVDEKTPSFIVSPSKQIWKDFSSGKGGTAISFLMEIEGFSYPEALRYAAKKYGIEIEELKKDLTEEEKKAQTDKDLLYKIHEVANDFFQNQLYETEEGRNIGLSYFKERELKPETIKKFQLGYSPELKNAFTQYAVSKGYSKEILEKSFNTIFPVTKKGDIENLLLELLKTIDNIIFGICFINLDIEDVKNMLEDLGIAVFGTFNKNEENSEKELVKSITYPFYNKTLKDSKKILIHLDTLEDVGLAESQVIIEALRDESSKEIEDILFSLRIDTHLKNRIECSFIAGVVKEE